MRRAVSTCLILHRSASPWRDAATIAVTARCPAG